MSERFMVDDAGTLIDMETRDTFDYVSDVVELLNMLHEENILLEQSKMEMANSLGRAIDENEQLKQENKTLRDYGRELLEYINSPPKHRKSIFNAVVCFKNKNGDVE